MAETQQAQLPLVERIANLKVEIAACITAEGQSFQTRYRHDWAMVQQDQIRISARSRIIAHTHHLSELKKQDPNSATQAYVEVLEEAVALHHRKADAALAEMNNQQALLNQAVKTHRDTFARRKMLQQQQHVLEEEQAAEEAAVIGRDTPYWACGCLKPAHPSQGEE